MWYNFSMSKLNHTIEPVFDKDSRILILGSFPSPKSREAGFYYGHAQNRFWKVLGAVLEEEFPDSTAGKKEILLKRHIALWDVLASCDIEGASDSSIRNPVPNDFKRIFTSAPIRAVFTTGKTAGKLYARFTGTNSIILPSPSPANCAMGMEKLISAYSAILPYLE